jgi:arginine deiminase
MLHRPGHELSRLTPRNNDRLLFDGIPWVAKAQAEHDAFAGALRKRGVEVLYLSDLLTEALGNAEARARAIEQVLTDRRHGSTLRRWLADWLTALDGSQLAQVLMTGLRNDEVEAPGIVAALVPADEFLIDPLPNLLFTRDSSVWIGDRVLITSLTMPARRRETQLTELIYEFHPRFAGVERLHGWQQEHVEGGDVLALSDGVLAVGVGERTTPAGVERVAETVFARGLVHTVLAVPIDQDRATMHLDTICTMVDVDAMIMYPNVAHRLNAYPIRPGSNGRLRIGEREHFLDAAAAAMGIERLRLIDTGLDPVTAEREQWDDGNNTLCVAPKVAIAYERNEVTNAQLADAGIEVVAIAGSELGSGRGGPRCMSCPISRDPLGG